MDALVGVTTTRVYALTLDGAPQAGATLTYSLWGPTGAALLTNVGVTDAGDGTYYYTLDGTSYLATPGTYRERWLGSYAGRDLDAAGPVLVGYLDPARSLTRRALRWDIAEMLDDQWIGTVTAATATSVTVPALPAPLNDWKGGEVFVYAGAGRSQARPITASGDWTGVLTVPSWTITPVVGASVEVHKRKTVAQYNSAINRAIRQARGAYVAMEDVSLVQSGTVTDYAVPAGLAWLSVVESEDRAASGVYAPLLQAEGAWSAGTGYLRIPAPLAGARLRLRGWRYPQPLDYDEQYGDLDPTYVEFAAGALLAAGDIRAPALDREAAAAAASYYQTLAASVLRRSALVNAVRVGGS